MKYRGFGTLVNREVGYAPYFISTIRYRIRKQLANNIVVTGEAGIGKSYLAMDICRVIEGLTPSGKDRFSVDQIIYTYSQLLKLIKKLKMGKVIMFDEPSYAMGKRDWYKEIQKALVLTIESFRFKVHPLVIPIINMNLLDKTIRSYLIQFHVVVYDRGKAIVYRLQPSQQTDKIYRHFFCKLHYDLADLKLCDKPTCLGCKKQFDKKNPCMVFRAQYERKKAMQLDMRYEQAEHEAMQKESQLFTDDQISQKLWNLRYEFINDKGKIDVELMRIICYRRLGIKLAMNRAYRIKKLMEYDHRDELNAMRI